MLPEDSRPDQELIRALNAGDTSAFDALYYRHRDWCLRLAHRFTRDHDDGARCNPHERQAHPTRAELRWQEIEHVALAPFEVTLQRTGITELLGQQERAFIELELRTTDEHRHETLTPLGGRFGLLLQRMREDPRIDLLLQQKLLADPHLLRHQVVIHDPS